MASKQACAAVVTRPDRKKGRGLTPQPSPVKQRAEELGLPVLTPESLQERQFLECLKQMKPEALFCVAFGRYLPGALREVFPYGINFHPSLLPRNRGAAPIPRAILKGERLTGVTAHQIADALDAGPIFWQKSLEISAGESAGELEERLALLTGEALLALLRQLEEGELQPREQDEREATYAPSLQPHEEKLHFTFPSELLLRQIRALSPNPGAYALLHKSCFSSSPKRFKIFSAELSDREIPPGTLQVISKELLVGTSTQALKLHEVQLEGKPRMRAQAFAQGLKKRAIQLL